MTRAVLGLDVGGANLKAAHTGGAARAVGFALWKAPERLGDELARLVGEMPAFEALALTMTGELCDCWESSRDGVAAILDAVASTSGSAPVRVWTNQGAFVDPQKAKSIAPEVASANWLALATFAGRFAPAGPALLIDVGTTTTDVIPLADGRPTPKGRIDPQRLTCGELVYRGWRRTPLCALAGPERAAELFATTHDLYLVLKTIDEDPADRDTADGRPATFDCASRRLARMVCADLETTTAQQRWNFAEEMHFRLTQQLALAVESVADRLPAGAPTVLASGSGEFLVPGVLRSPAAPDGAARWPVVSLRERLGPTASAAACAHAVATLCQEREG